MSALQATSDSTEKEMSVDLVKEIHASEIYGIFIETGCGVPVAQSLLSVSGASKTVYQSICPYSSELVRKEYGISSHVRAISVEYVQGLINKYKALVPTTVNTIYAASFQVGSDKKTVTHGWIGLLHQNMVQYYHVTVRQELSRLAYIDVIGGIGLKLIHMRNNVTYDIDLSIDIVLNEDFQSNIPPLLRVMSNEALVCFNTENSMCRSEDLFRDQKEIIIYKGSFNPPTIAHVDIARQTQLSHPGSTLVFMISLNTVDKGVVDYVAITKRIKWITALGYNCVVNKKGRFTDTISYFKNSFPTTKLIFPVGKDTEQRMERGLFVLVNVEFKVFPRTDVSSTRIREAIQNHDQEAINELLPLQLQNLLL